MLSFISVFFNFKFIQLRYFRHSDPAKLKETSQDVQRLSPTELKKRQTELKVGNYASVWIARLRFQQLRFAFFFFHAFWQNAVTVYVLFNEQ